MIAKGPGINIWGKGMVGEHTEVGSHTEIGGLVGDYCKIQAFVFIPPGVMIGNKVFIGPHVVFTNDKYPDASPEWTQTFTMVENNVSIGANATILPVNIGKGAVIGAGAVVTKNVPAGETWVGNPAKKLIRKKYAQRKSKLKRS